jgi:hypothetical protein
MAAAQMSKPRPPMADSVEAWRLHTLLQAGYPIAVAERVAQSGADLHQAVELVRQGCEPQVAEQILT